MKQVAAAIVIALSAGAALAQASKAPAVPSTPVASGVHKKAPPAPRHKKVMVKKERSKKTASF